MSFTVPKCNIFSASHSSLQVKEAESARIDDVAIRRRPHHASDGPNAHLRRACVRKNSKHPKHPLAKCFALFRDPPAPTFRRGMRLFAVETLENGGAAGDTRGPVGGAGMGRAARWAVSE